MNTDLIFDALDYIDDDMLEDVDALRTKKKVKPNRIWMRYASVAACLCVIIGAVYLLDRTGMVDTSEVADEMAQDNMSGEEKVHNYVRADIITSDSTVLAVNDPQKITAIYDILRTELQPEAAADDKLYSENDNKAAGEMADGNGKTEDIGGIIAQSQYTIKLISADGAEKVYTLVGKVVRNESTGETFSLSSNQYNELMEILNQK